MRKLLLFVFLLSSVSALAQWPTDGKRRFVAGAIAFGIGDTANFKTAADTNVVVFQIKGGDTAFWYRAKGPYYKFATAGSLTGYLPLSGGSLTPPGHLNATSIAVTNGITSTAITLTDRVATDKLTATGNTSVGGSLAVVGGIQTPSIIQGGGLTVTGNGSIGGALTVTGTIFSNQISGTMITAVQPNITKLGTLSVITVVGYIDVLGPSTFVDGSPTGTAVTASGFRGVNAVTTNGTAVRASASAAGTGLEVESASGLAISASGKVNMAGNLTVTGYVAAGTLSTPTVTSPRIAVDSLYASNNLATFKNPFYLYGDGRIASRGTNAYFKAQTYLGTWPSPTALTAGSTMEGVAVTPYDGTTFGADAGALRWIMAENATVSAAGTYSDWQVGVLGTRTRTTAVRAHQRGAKVFGYLESDTLVQGNWSLANTSNHFDFLYSLSRKLRVRNDGIVQAMYAFEASKDGSGTFGAGAYFGVFNDAGDRAWLTQLNGSNNLDLWYYNGSPTNVGVFNNSTGAYTALSDSSMKKDFEPYKGNALATVMKLKPTLYRMKKENGTAKHFWFLAQDIQNVVPQAYVESDRGDGTKFKGIDPGPILATAVAAIQQLNKKITAQDKEIGDLKARLLAIEKLVKK